MNAKQAEARAEDIKAVIAKKTIRAPFSGKLGIRQVNLGQVLKEGDPIVTLQTLDPIYADFALPQQQLSSLVPGMKVRVTSDVLPGKELEGRISAINPLVDADTRQVRLQATVRNPSQELRPGMFVNIEGKLVRQQFVRLGQKRGDFVAVTNGLKEGETVVSTGVFKLRNGESVLVDNHLAPDFRKSPRPENK
jgi:membrane fusion protein (multidrug efflux system)